MLPIKKNSIHVSHLTILKPDKGIQKALQNNFPQMLKRKEKHKPNINLDVVCKSKSLYQIVRKHFKIL